MDFFRTLESWQHNSALANAASGENDTSQDIRNMLREQNKSSSNHNQPMFNNQMDESSDSAVMDQLFAKLKDN